jgi:hypothetical protein
MHSLTSALDGGELSASHPSRPTHGERAPGIHQIQRWVGPQASCGNNILREICSKTDNQDV